jgi:hypothetical protein
LRSGCIQVDALEKILTLTGTISLEPEPIPVNVKVALLGDHRMLYLLREKYPLIDNNFANYQPTFLIDQIIAINEFEGEPYHMTPALIDRAWANMFVKQEHIAK